MMTRPETAREVLEARVPRRRRSPVSFFWSNVVLAHTFHRRRYRVLQFALDLLALVMAWRWTLDARVTLNPFMSASLTHAELSELAPPLAGILLLWIAVAFYRGIYRSDSARTAAGSLAGVAESAVVAGLLTIVVTFFSREAGLTLSRSFVLLFAPINFLTMMGAHYLALSAAVVLESKWPTTEGIAVVGEGQAAQELVDQLRECGQNAIRVAGIILPAGSRRTQVEKRTRVIGSLGELGALINRHRLDRLMIVDGHLSDEELDTCARIAKRMGVVASRAFGLLDRDAQLQVTERYGLRLLELRSVEFTRGQQFVKRGFDIFLSALLLLLLSPLLVLLVALIKLTSEGPILYKSPRVGKGGRHFTFLKFRSMYHGANDREAVRGENERTGHVFKIRDDPRVTPLGRFMRRYSLDELPQILNVLWGEMSLVGPRPLPAEDLDPDGQSREFAAWAAQRSLVLPGITGLWQVSGRSDLPFEKWIELDIHYIRSWSLTLDLKVLLETPLVVLTGRGAY